MRWLFVATYAAGFVLLLYQYFWGGPKSFFWLAVYLLTSAGLLALLAKIKIRKSIRREGVVYQREEEETRRKVKAFGLVYATGLALMLYQLGRLGKEEPDWLFLLVLVFFLLFLTGLGTMILFFRQAPTSKHLK